MTVGKRTVRSRRRTVSGRKKGARGLKILLLLALTGLSCYGAKRCDLAHYFSVREVSVESTPRIPASELLALSREALLGRSMLGGLNSAEVILGRHPLIKNVTLHRRFPDRVKVVVTEREPVAMLNCGELLPVDDEGYILPIKDPSACARLPILTPRKAAFESLDQGDARHRLDKDGRMLLETSQAFRRNAPEILPMISEFTVNSEGKITLVTMNEGVQVVIGKWMRPETVHYLKWMMARLAEGGQSRPQEVDLSYEGQIIVKDANDFIPVSSEYNL